MFGASQVGEEGYIPQPLYAGFFCSSESQMVLLFLSRQQVVPKRMYFCGQSDFSCFSFSSLTSQLASTRSVVMASNSKMEFFMIKKN